MSSMIQVPQYRLGGSSGDDHSSVTSLEQPMPSAGRAQPRGTAKNRVIYACVSWCIYVVLALLIWSCCYPSPPVVVADPGDIEDAKTTFQEGHFSCLRSPEICLCACLCPGLRWADTMNLMGFLKIGVGLSVVFFCALLNGFTSYANAAVGPFTLCLALYYRHKLREQFNLPAWTCGSCCLDGLYILCCPWCAIAQEARAATHYLQKGSSSQ